MLNRFHWPVFMSFCCCTILRELAKSNMNSVECNSKCYKGEISEARADCSNIEEHL